MTTDSARVLIVDDEPAVHDLYCEHLTDRYDVATATGGEKALEKLDETFDVVLLDRRMPELNGDEVASRIEDLNINPKVVMVTGVDPDLDLLQLDFSEYLVKPVTRSGLREAVERMTDHAKLEAELREMLSLASKLSTLENKLDAKELEQSEQYQRLTLEFENQKEELQIDEDEMNYYHEAIIWKLRGALSEIGV
jgi:Response regulator containing CheY-like receiver, AAA-type ATPase, and DNA-binding domains